MLEKTQLAQWLNEAGLALPEEKFRIRSLTGGVSSEVYRVDLPGRTLCIKQALPKLRVQADWSAPVERSHREVLWLRTAAESGLHVPQILAEWPDLNMFAMSWFDPADYGVWKLELAAGSSSADAGFAVGRAIGIIHSATAGRPEDFEAFADDGLFRSLRIEPFFTETARRHPDLMVRLGELADRVLAERAALIHGDVSPKNILLGRSGPVLLDAECAWYGDPAFDLAFCSTHLLLKTLWRPESARLHLDSLERLEEGYFQALRIDGAKAVRNRSAALVGALLLARIDGKSPVEYLTGEPVQAFVRQVARDLILTPARNLHEVRKRWEAHWRCR